MKKTILLLFLFCLTSAAFSQTKFGVKLGGNLSNVHYNDNTPNYDNKPGFQFGVISEIPVIEKLYFKPELLYSLKGFSTIYVPGGTTYYNLHYLNLPLLVSYKPVKLISFHAGPELGYLLSQKLGTKEPFFKQFNKNFDISLAFGTAIHLSKNIALEARYVAGLVKSQKLYYADAQGSLSFLKYDGVNRSFQLSVVYTFGFKK
jgi:hypothetical protein